MATTHSRSRTPEYNSWRAMRERCNNKNYHAYNRYGGRGVKVCPEWDNPNGFIKFFEHVGKKPTPQHTIGRIDNNRGYEPGNVKWETKREQSQNRNFCHSVEFDGKTMTLAEWSRELGIHYETIRYRFGKGLPIAQVLRTGHSKQNPMKL